MRFGYGRNKAVSRNFGFNLTSAGWLVVEYSAVNDEMDVLAGAFDTAAQAIEAARKILNENLDEIVDKLSELSA